mgnify:CR=1 FL=1
MTVECFPFNLDKKISFNVQYKHLWYSVGVEVFPLRKDDDKKELIKQDIREMLSPIAHLEFKVLDIDKSIYRSYFLMPTHAMYINEKLGNCNINMIVELIVEEIGFEKRSDSYIISQQESSQLSLF